MRITLGYACLVLSTVLYVVIFALPFLDFPTETKLITGTVLYGTSYFFMFVGGALLGREAMDKLKALFKKYWKRKPEVDSLAEPQKAQDGVEE